MILQKSKIYEYRIIKDELIDKKTKEIYLDYIKNKLQNFGMFYAAYMGHEKIIYYFIYQGAYDWDTGMALSAKGGREKLVDFFISKGVSHWDRGMINTIQKGGEKFVHFFISKGADEWKEGLFWARYERCKRLSNFFQKRLN